jgi:hypothetical protein
LQFRAKAHAEIIAHAVHMQHLLPLLRASVSPRKKRHPPMARTKERVRADARARAGGQVVRRTISKQAARILSVEEVEAARLASEVR